MNRMLHVRRYRAVALALVATVFCSWSVVAVAVDDAGAYEWTIYNGGLAPGQRGVGGYYYNYGVGWWASSVLDGDDVCIGAKTRSDGSGGNAIPFLCVNIPPDQKRWTPGGQSNYGYPTVINNEASWVTGMGIANRR